jgi:plasmid stabilization system protein ParE
MRLEWAIPALDDLRHIANPSSPGEQSVGIRYARRVADAVTNLADHPGLGRLGRVNDTRELVVTGTPFLVMYSVGGDTVTVLRVLHHARRWPSTSDTEE